MAQSGPALSFGDGLRALREERGSSLDELARATRVSVRQLEALEAGRLDDLPAPVFVRGFIRAYCHALGEPPEAALERYARLTGEELEARRESRPSHPLAPPAPSVALSFALFAILGGSLLAVNLFVRPDAESVAPQPTRNAIIAGVPLDPPPAAPPPIAAPPVAAPAAARPAVAPSTASTPRAPATPQRLVVKALERTRLRVQVDDAPPVD